MSADPQITLSYPANLIALSCPTLLPLYFCQYFIGKRGAQRRARPEIRRLTETCRLSPIRGRLFKNGNDFSQQGFSHVRTNLASVEKDKKSTWERTASDAL